MRKTGQLVKASFIQRAIDTHNYHTRLVQSDPTWDIRKTAASLNRSIGSISEDLLIVSWLRTHKEQLQKFKYAKDALAFIRGKKAELNQRAYLD